MRKKHWLTLLAVVLVMSTAACTVSPTGEVAAPFAPIILQLILLFIAAGQTGAAACITLVCFPI